MTNHNYGYDINRILSKSSKKGLNHIETYVLSLDDMLFNLKEMTPDLEKFIHTTIEFLYGATEE